MTMRKGLLSSQKVPCPEFVQPSSSHSLYPICTSLHESCSQVPLS